MSRERLESSQESLLQATGQRTAPLCEDIGELRRRPRPRQLEQGERVAARLGDDPVADAGVDGPLTTESSSGPASASIRPPTASSGGPRIVAAVAHEPR